MMKSIKQLLMPNFKVILQFELIFKLLTIAIFSPVFHKIINAIINIAGYSYLTVDNIPLFLKDPLVWPLLFLLLLFLAFYTVFDISTVILLQDASRQKKQVILKDVLLFSFKKSIKVFHYSNILIIFLVLFLIPLFNIGLTTSFLGSLVVPAFIMEYIEAHIPLALGMIAFVFLLFFLLLRWLYVLHYYVLEDCTFKEARKMSKNLGCHHHITDCLSIIGMQVFVSICFCLILFLGFFVIVGIHHFLEQFLVIESILLTIVWLFLAIIFCLYLIFSTPISYASVSSLYYCHKEKKDELIVPVSFQENKKRISKGEKVFKLLFFSACFFLGTLFTYEVMIGNINLFVIKENTLEITAHRGASRLYPENTFIAFYKAKEMEADWIELDVHATKDGKMIIMHDSSLKRTTGLKKKIWQVTYEEIKDLDADILFGEEFKGEKIPLLEDVLKWAKANKIKLNIEMKPSGYETDFELSVVNLIKKYDLEEDCAITSQVYELLKTVKQLDNKIKTGYIMPFAFGDFISLEDIDLFSVELTNVNQTMVDAIHKRGKKLHVWTVNTREDIEKMMDLEVDNIITDDVDLAKQLIEEKREKNVIEETIIWIENLLS